MAIRFLQGQAITGTLSVSSTTTLAAATVSAPSTSDDSTRIPSTAWVKDQGYITSGSLPTVNNNTITFTAGTGLTGGGAITLNQSFNETITFNNSITNNNQLTNGAGYTTNTGTTTAGNTQTFTNKSGNISQWTNDSGYTTNVGDITGVTAGSGMSGGGTSGTVTLTNADKGSSQNIFKNVASDSGTAVADNNNDTLTIVGAGSVTTAVVGDTLTITGTDDNENYYVSGASQSGGTLTLTRVGLSTLQVTGFTNASNSQTFTNKSGNISQWTNDSGYITSGSLPTVNNATITLTAGTGLSGGGTITLNQASNETVTFNNSITNNNQLTNGAGYTTNTGTVTSVALSASGDALQITGTPVTGSGTLAISFQGDTDDYINGEGDIVAFPSIPQGDITAVVAGTGLSGGGTSGSVTLNNTITNNNQLTNGAGYTTNVGDITGVTAGSGMSGGGSSGSVTLTNSDKGSSQNIYKNFAVSGQSTIVADSNNDTLTLVASGGMTITTNASTDTITFNPNDDNDNYYVTSGSYSSGTLTLNRQGLSAITVTGFPTNNNQLTNGAGYITSASLPTVSNATITFTAGTGLTGGGAVTLNQSSNETVTFNNSITNNNQLTNGAGYTTNTGTTTASNSQTFTNKGGNISQWTNDSGYTTASGTMSSWILKEGNGTETSTVTNGETVTFAQGSGIQTELTSTSSGGTLTISNTITNNNQLTNGAGYTTNTGTTTASNTQTFTNKSGNISQWTNDSGYTTNVGDITGVTAGSGISGGGTSGTVTITNSDKGSSQNIFKNFAVSGQSTVVADSNNDTITFAAAGGMTITTDASTDTITFNPNDDNNNYYVSGASYASGTLTLTRNGLSTLTATGFPTNNNQLSNGAGYTTNTGTTTASNSQTFTNKSGNISQWTNNSGYVTSSGVTSVGLSASGDALQITNTPITGSGTIAISFQGDTTDYINGEGDITAFPSIPQGDITAVVAGTGMSGGGTSGSVTLNCDITNNNQLTNGAGYTTNTGTTTASNSQTFTNKGGNISQWTNNSGYTTNVGDITGVTAGTGMSGGGTSGSVTLNCDIAAANNATITFVGGDGMKDGGNFTTNQSFNETITLNMDYAGTDNFILASANAVGTSIQTTDKIIYSDVGNNDIQYGNVSDLPFTNNSGDITNVVAGTGMSGGGTSGSVTLNCDITNNNQLTNGAGYTTNTGTTTASNSQTFTNKGGNISQWTNNSGYITSGSLPTVNDATITLTAGTGLTGGGTITLNQSSNETVTFNNSITNNNQLTNGAGYTTNTGTVTGSSGAANRIPYWSASTNLSSSIDLSFNPTSGALICGGQYELVVSSDYFELNNASEDLYTRITGFGGDGQLTIGEGVVFTTGANFYVPSGKGISVGTSATASNTIRSTGNIIAYYSDERLKDFEGNIPNALDKVCQLGGYYYKQNEVAAELGYENYERQVGVNAQEVHKIMPEVVEIAPISYNEEANGVEYLTVDYAKLVPLLIESIKELKAEVDALKAK